MEYCKSIDFHRLTRTFCKSKAITLGFRYTNEYLFYDTHYSSQFKVFMSRYQKYGILLPDYGIIVKLKKINVDVNYKDEEFTLKCLDTTNTNDIYEKTAQYLKKDSY